VLIKKPAPNNYRVQSIYGGTVEIAEPQACDLLQADTPIARLPFDLLYARFDLVRVDGHLSVMEVELIEPILSFNLFPEELGVLSTPPGSLLESDNNVGLLCDYVSI